MVKDTFHVIEFLNYKTEKNEFRVIKDSNFDNSMRNLNNQGIYYKDCLRHCKIAREANLFVKQYAIRNMVKDFHPN